MSMSHVHLCIMGWVLAFQQLNIHRAMNGYGHSHVKSIVAVCYTKQTTPKTNIRFANTPTHSEVSSEVSAVW